MATEIRSNGSKWAGEQPDSIETLLAVLKGNVLDRRFEQLGGEPFIEIARPGDTWAAPRTVHFFGNFLNISHVFDILTTDASVIYQVSEAIAENMRRPDYLEQPGPQQAEAIRAEAAQRDRDARVAKRREQLERELANLAE